MINSGPPIDSSLSQPTPESNQKKTKKIILGYVVAGLFLSVIAATTIYVWQSRLNSAEVKAKQSEINTLKFNIDRLKAK